jgi:hypothetical protein
MANEILARQLWSAKPSETVGLSAIKAGFARVHGRPPTQRKFIRAAWPHLPFNPSFCRAWIHEDNHIPEQLA